MSSRGNLVPRFSLVGEVASSSGARGEEISTLGARGEVVSSLGVMVEEFSG